MIRIHQTFGAHAGRVVEFGQDVVRMGRQPTSELAFDPHADIDASGRHAEIRRESGGYVLLDLGSRNGTFLNGHRVLGPTPLRTGDEIECGPGGPRLRVELVQAVFASASAPTGVATDLPMGGAPVPSAAGWSAPPPHASGAMPPAPIALHPGMSGNAPQPPLPQTPMPGMPQTAPPPAVDASGSRMGPRTVGVMIHAAVDAERKQRATIDALKLAVFVLAGLFLMSSCGMVYFALRAFGVISR